MVNANYPALLPLEYKPIEVAIVGQIELVLNFDDTNKIRRNPKFYIVVDPKRKWTIEVHNLNIVVAQVSIDYEQFPIQCNFCNNLEHMVKDCVHLKVGHPPRVSYNFTRNVHN